MALLLKNLLFTVLVPGTAAVYFPLWIAVGQPRSSGIGMVTAAVILLVGAGIYASSQWNFAALGRGTPAPIDAPKRLVIYGPYRHVRNPMYLGVLAVILGWAILFSSVVLVVYGLVLGTCFHLFTVLYEERHLLREFGSEYEAYCKRVGRWRPRLRG